MMYPALSLLAGRMGKKYNEILKIKIYFYYHFVFDLEATRLRVHTI